MITFFCWILLFEKYFCIFKSECQLNGSNFSLMFIQMFHFSQLSMHFKLDETRTERRREGGEKDWPPSNLGRPEYLAAYKIKAFGPTLISSVNNSFQDDHFGFIINNYLQIIPPSYCLIINCLFFCIRYGQSVSFPLWSQPFSLSYFWLKSIAIKTSSIKF